MNKYFIIKLENNSSYAVIDILDNNNKTYFLVLSIMKNKTINNEFEICIYNEINNCFEKIINPEEFELIIKLFEKRLEYQKKIIKEMENINIDDMVKLKIKRINNINYTLERSNGEKINKTIIFNIKNKPNINSDIYVSKKIIGEKNIFVYGVINDLDNVNNDEIIKIVDKNKEYYLQRYYG